MVYGVQAAEFDSDALSKLEADNLIRIEYKNDLVSLSHDVLEDWALERYIDDVYQVQPNTAQEFLDRIGHEPAMNRAFRLWLHQKMRYGDDVTQLILAILYDEKIARCWQDETISAILHGDNSVEFFSQLEEKLFDNNGKMLKRFCFILRISCKIHDQELMKLVQNENRQTQNEFGVLYLKPYGESWENIIDFLYVHRSAISQDLFSHIVEVLYEWSSIIYIQKESPVSARNAGLLALQLLMLVKDSYRDEGGRKKLLTVIIKVVPYISDEFKNMLDEDIFSCSNKGQRLSYVREFCTMALVENNTAFLCKYAPDTLIKLALHEWLIDESKKDKYSSYGGHKEVEECFGLHQDGGECEFFSASGRKGPFCYLLCYHPKKGLDFIIKLLNITAAKYALSGLDSAKNKVAELSVLTVQSELEKVEIYLRDGTIVRQYCSGRMWAGYRGITFLPELLQSALMALENWLIDLVQSPQLVDKVEWIFDYVLRQSNSVMPTAVLVSVATGFPDKIRENAFPFLQTPKLYELDSMRMAHEHGANIYGKERQISALRPWRKENLEKVIIYYQFTNLKEEMLSFIDKLRLSAPKNEAWRFRFHRIDSRGWQLVEDKENNRIIFTPVKLEPDLKVLQQETQEHMAMIDRFFRLGAWSDKFLKKEVMEESYYAGMDEVLAEAKKLFGIISNNNKSEVVQMQVGGIIKAAAILLKEYASKMIKEDLFWCVGLVTKAVLQNADNVTADQIDIEGSAPAASILPILLDFTGNDEELKFVRKIIVIALTHANKTIRIKAANGVKEYLWQRDSEFAQKCIIGMVEYSRLTMENIQSRRRSFGIPSNEKFKENKWLSDFRDKLSGEEAFNVDINIITFQSHSASNILLPCLMIPDGSVKSEHVLFMSKLVALLLEEEKQQNDNANERKIDYRLLGDFAKSFAWYFLSLTDQDQQIFMEHLRCGCNIAPNFMNYLLLNLDYFTKKSGRKELYWKIWRNLSKTVQGIALTLVQGYDRRGRRDERTKLIRRMLYADTPWLKSDYENQDIIFGKKLIIDFVENVGSNPDVFEAMASLMYHFPTIFFESGLQITAKYLQERGSEKLFLGVNTAFYLERALQRFLLLDNTITLPYAVHRDCCILLDAIVETASSGAYYLREHLIRSRRVAQK
jgi:hypothetical protein